MRFPRGRLLTFNVGGGVSHARSHLSRGRPRFHAVTRYVWAFHTVYRICLSTAMVTRPPDKVSVCPDHVWSMGGWHRPKKKLRISDLNRVHIFNNSFLHPWLGDSMPRRVCCYWCVRVSVTCVRDNFACGVTECGASQMCRNVKKIILKSFLIKTFVQNLSIRVVFRRVLVIGMNIWDLLSKFARLNFNFSSLLHCIERYFTRTKPNDFPFLLFFYWFVWIFFCSLS